jgi:hypothetical protein
LKCYRHKFKKVVSGITDVSISLEESKIAEAVDGSLDVGSYKMWW